MIKGPTVPFPPPFPSRLLPFLQSQRRQSIRPTRDTDLAEKSFALAGKPSDASATSSKTSLKSVVRIRYFLRLYRTHLKVSIMDNIQYRASGMIWMIGSVLEPTIYLVVWSTVANTKGGEVGGYTASEFAAYYIILMFINHLTFTWIMQTFQWRIQYGELSYELLRPIHPIHRDVTDNIGFKMVQMTVMIPALIVLILLFEPEFNIEFSNLLLAIPVVILAFAVRFILEWSIALAAFWTTRITAINNSYFAIMMFLSGRIAPIALLPVWLQPIVESLPFYYVVAFPVEIITGKLSQGDVIEGVYHLIFWLLIALGVLKALWSRAIRNYSAVGG